MQRLLTGRRGLRRFGCGSLVLICLSVLGSLAAPENASAQTGFNAGSNIPYYVEPSRFQYNRPQARGEITRSIPNTTFNIQVPRRTFLYAPNPYYYGGYYNRPRYYYRPIGPNTYLGPFVPFRRF